MRSKSILCLCILIAMGIAPEPAAAKSKSSAKQRDFRSFEKAIEAAESLSGTESAECYQQAAELTKNSHQKSKALYQAGLTWSRSGVHDKSKKAYESIVAMKNPPHDYLAQAYRMLGILYNSRGHYQKAEQSYKAFLKKNERPS